MIINRRYVLAHTPNIVLKRPFSNPTYDSGLDHILAGLTGGASSGQAGSQGLNSDQQGENYRQNHPYYNPNS